MTNAIWARDIVAFSVQIVALVLAGAGVALVCRLRQPGAVLLFWRALLFACLALPFCQPWHVPAAQVVPAAVVASESVTPNVSSASAIAPSLTRPSASLPDILLAAFLGGIAIRVVWLAMGATALRRLRRSATPLSPLPDRITEVQARVGARSEILLSDRASGPMTFGLFRPVILLPTDVRELAPHVQEAMAYHELIHVRRRDWLSELFEEGVRTLLWFHPAVWWLIGRIRLAREQVVDEAVIRFTQSREQYVDALLVVALRKSPFTLALAPTFLRRRLLKRRVAQIMQETTMTTYRLIASLTTSAVVVCVAAVFAIRSFPLQAQAAARGQAPSGDPVQIISGGENLIHGRLPEYSERAIKQHVEGDVVLDVAVDDRGEVADARVLTGPDELRRSALESVLQWHYAPAAVSNRSIQVVMRFHTPLIASSEKAPGWAPDGNELALVTKDGQTFRVRRDDELREKDPELRARQRAEHQMMEMEEAISSPHTAPAEKEELKAKLSRMKQELVADKIGFATEREAGTDRPMRLARVRTERFPDGMALEILSKAGLAVGDVVSKQTLERVRSIATETDEHIKVEIGHEESGDVVLTFITR